mgnify:FL=1
MKVAIQMDPIGPININADSTFRIALEAQARGHELFYYTPERLAYVEGRVIARGWPLQVQRVEGAHYTLGAETEVDLAEFDVVWLRQDPPFDMFYITTTHLLQRLQPKTLVVNDPFWVRNFPEKLLVLDFPDLTPPTAIARDLTTIKAFRERHGDIILKPLYGNGRPTASVVDATRRRIGLEASALTRPEVDQEIASNIRFQRELDLSGTPAWVVGNKVLVGAVGYDGLKAAIADARAARAGK